MRKLLFLLLFIPFITEAQMLFGMGQKAHPDYLAVLNAARADAVTLPTYRQRLKHVAMVRKMDTNAGVWDKFDVVYVFQQNAAEAFGYYNWQDASTFKITKSGTTTWTSDVGVAGNASTGFYNTGYAGGGGAKYQQNDASITLSAGGASAGSQVYISKRTSTTNIARVNGSSQARLNTSSATTVTPTATGSFMSFQRNNSSTVDVWSNGVLETSGHAQTSSSVSAEEFYILAGNVSDTAELHTNGTIEFVAIGQYFATDHLALVNAWADYSNAP